MSRRQQGGRAFSVSCEQNWALDVILTFLCNEKVLFFLIFYGLKLTSLGLAISISIGLAPSSIESRH